MKYLSNFEFEADLIYFDKKLTVSEWGSEQASEQLNEETFRQAWERANRTNKWASILPEYWEPTLNTLYWISRLRGWWV